MTVDSPQILIVEDEDPIRETYARILTDSYDVSTVATGQGAIDALSPDLDIVLLDRRLPDVDGDTVLRELQARNYDCYVAMVTAVDPDFDILEMCIDDYLVKPLSHEELQDAVERLLALSEFDSTYHELSQKRVKRSTLLQEKSRAELDDNDEFAQLHEDIQELEAELTEMVDELGDIKRELIY